MSTLRVAAINNPSASSGGLAISASGNVTGAGLDLITTQSFSAVSSVSINNCFSGDYDNYRVIVRGTGSDNGGGTAAMFLRLRLAGSDAAGANYNNSLIYNTNSAGPTRVYQTAQTSGSVGGTLYDVQGTISMDIASVAIAVRTVVNYLQSCWGTAGNLFSVGSVIHDVGTAYDGFTLSPQAGAGTITGTVSVYGYKS